MERIRESGKLTLGYRTDSRPFSYMDASGNPAGYAIALCEAVSGAIKTESGNESLAVQWVPVTIEDRFAAVREGKIDLLCGPDAETLERRKEVAFSIPVYPGRHRRDRAGGCQPALRESPGRQTAFGADLARVAGAHSRTEDLFRGRRHAKRALARGEGPGAQDCRES